MGESAPRQVEEAVGYRLSAVSWERGLVAIRHHFVDSRYPLVPFRVLPSPQLARGFNRRANADVSLLRPEAYGAVSHQLSAISQSV